LLPDRKKEMVKVPGKYVGRGRGWHFTAMCFHDYITVGFFDG
jgi:hypothetical protein